MAKRPSKQGLSTGILIVLLAGVLVSQALQAGATHQPANKAAAAGSKVVVARPGERTPILDVTMKTSKPQDLIFSVSLECSIITQTRNPGGEDNAQAADGTLRVWVEIDGNVVPINSAVSPPNDPSEPGNDTDEVTFCSRRHETEIRDMEDDDGTDDLRIYLDTKQANAFNWIYMNAGSAVHEIVVYAEFESENENESCFEEEDPGPPPTIVNTGLTCSDGFIGNRTLTVFPERLANDAVV